MGLLGLHRDDGVYGKILRYQEVLSLSCRRREQGELGKFFVVMFDDIQCKQIETPLDIVCCLN